MAVTLTTANGKLIVPKEVDNVDVRLGWKDFVYAVESLRHFSFGSDMNQRDWFTLNPMEIFLLGCQTIIDKSYSTQKFGTVLLGMDYLGEILEKKLSLFQWTIQILIQAIKSDSTTTFLTKRCCSILAGMSSSTAKDQGRLYFMYLSEVCESLTTLQDVRTNKSDCCSHLEEIIREADSIKRLSSFNEELHIPDIIQGRPALKLTLISRKTGVTGSALWTHLGFSNVAELVHEVSIDPEEACSVLMSTLRILVDFLCVPHKKKEPRNKPGVIISSFDDSDPMELSPDFQSRAELYIQLISEVEDAIRECLVKDREVASPSFTPNKILEYILVELSSLTPDSHVDRSVALLAESLLPSIKAFWSYSCEVGTPEAAEDVVMYHLLEYLISAVESDVPRTQSLTVVLPNLLRIGFGINRQCDAVCKLLEYGSLSFRSRHGSSLIKEDLWFILKSNERLKPIAATWEENARIADFKESYFVCRTALENMINDIALLSGENALECFSQQLFDTLYPTDVIENYSTIPESTEVDQRIADDVSGRECNLISMLTLACNMIKRGLSITYTFASVVPKLLAYTDFPYIPEIEELTQLLPYHVPSDLGVLPWQGCKTFVTCKILQFCVDCSKSLANPTFQICAVLIPKLVRNFDKTGYCDATKFAMLNDFITEASNQIEAGLPVDALVSHGLDLMSLLMPESCTPTEMKSFLKDITLSVSKLAKTSSLLLLKDTCEFFVTRFEQQRKEMKGIFTFLLSKGSRNDIRNIRGFKHEFITEDRFSFIVDALGAFSRGIIKSKHVAFLSESFKSLVAIETKLIDSLKQQAGDDYMDDFPFSANIITQEMINDLSKELINGYELIAQKRINRSISNLTLYQVLYPVDITNALLSGNDNIFNQLSKSIPTIITENALVMKALFMFCKRLENMHLPRFKGLHGIVVLILQKFLASDFTLNTEQNWQKVVSIDSEDPDTLPYRIAHLEEYIHNLPENSRRRSNLLEYGYNPRLWQPPVISSTVKTDGSLSLDENLRQSLYGCFQDYVELLRQLGVLNVSIDGKEVPVNEVFTDDLAVVDLKGRRAIVSKLIEKSSSRTTSPSIAERRLEILLREEKIEQDIHNESEQPIRERQFTISLLIGFFDAGQCCDSNIIGCYAPSGDHCQKPLETGLRSDCGFISIRDEDGNEIENAEVIFAQEGMLVYKVYTCGHPYDTSQVWLSFFSDLIGKHRLFPAILLPYHFPNHNTWETLRRRISTEVTGAVITFDYDFSAEWNSYFDSRPDSIRCGKDLVLSEGFDTQKVSVYRRQSSYSSNKDLAGMIFDLVMERILENEELKQFKFLGRHIAAFLSFYISSGEPNSDIIHSKFDFERWKRNRLLGKYNTKEKIVSSLVKVSLTSTDRYLASVEKSIFFHKKQRQFFQMKAFLEQRLQARKISQSAASKYGAHLKEINYVLKRNIILLRIDQLPKPTQEEVMHWVFANEDRVWRYRGGRDGYETMQHYLNLLPHILKAKTEKSRKTFPGFLIAISSENWLYQEEFQARKTIAYAVGEYVSFDSITKSDEFDFDEDNEVNVAKQDSGDKECYEIVTAWVDPRFRGLGISVELYDEIFNSVTSHYVAFDILERNAEKIVDSSPLFRLLAFFGLLKFIVKSRQQSYLVQTATRDEQFEKIVLNRVPMKLSLVCTDLVCNVLPRRWKLIATVSALSIAIGIYCTKSSPKD